MPSDRSMSAAHDQGTEDSSSLSSLLLTVEVESCPEDQYLDESKKCQPCTVCGPGTQHKNDEECGYGRGKNQTCEPCPSQYYQDKTSFIPVQCQRCITCDSLANTTRECSPEHDAECGPCPPGMYYQKANNCISCKDGDSTREECRMTTPITPEPTESTSFPTPVVSDATPSTPADMVATTDQTGTTSEVPCPVPKLTTGLVVSGCTAEGVAAEGDNCTYSCTSGSLRGRSTVICGPDGMFSPGIPTCGVDPAVLIGAILGGAILGMLVIAALIGLYKILKPGQGTDEETGGSAEVGSTSGHPGQNCDGVYDIREGEIIPLVAPSQDNSDERQARQSSLPVGPSPVDPSTVSPPSACSGPSVSGQDAPPASLPREDDALCQVEQSQDDQAQSNPSVDPPPVSPPSACSGPSVSGQNAPPASLPREDDALCQVEQSEDDQPRSIRSNLSVGPNQVSPPSACSGPSVSGQDAPPASLPREDDTVPLSGEMAASPEP